MKQSVYIFTNRSLSIHLNKVIILSYICIIDLLKNMTKENKKQKTKEENPLLRNITALFIKNPFASYNYKQLSHAMGIKDKAGRELVKITVEELQTEGLLIEDKRGKYKLNQYHVDDRIVKSLYVTGRVDMKQTGKAYIITEKEGEDIFIASNNTNRAIHGDTVKVLVFPKRKGRKTEGEIVEVISREKKQFVGVVKINNDYGFLVPDNSNITIDLFLPPGKLGGAEDGDKAIARLIDWPENSKNPFGEIIKVLGKPGNNNVEMQSILAGFDFPLSFTKEAEEEANKVETVISKAEISKRRDFRKITTFTIDPDDAKDFDDALSIRKTDNDCWEIGIHIADVSHYVIPDTAIDKEAFERATSVYLVDRVIPMLPEILSNNVCSLRPNEEKLCFSAVFEMDENARVIEEWFGKTVIKSDRRFTYDEAQEVIESNKGDFAHELKTLHNLAKKLRSERFAHGAINFESQEVKFRLDEAGVPIEAFVKEMKDSNHLIEEFMLLANKLVAERIGKTMRGRDAATFVYRIHDEPSPEKITDFAEFINKLGYNIKLDTRRNLASSLNKLFNHVKGKAEENMVESLAIRTMAKAHYSTDNIGHYGLAFDYYTHFTSPIRRYPDLMVHRLLEQYLNDGKSADKNEYEKYCKHSSEMEKKATEAERASVKYKQAEYLSTRIGQEFDGHISGVSKWGIFVQITEGNCEGMISMRDLDDDFYILDEDNYMVKGQRSGVNYKLGDEIKVKVKRIDLSRKQIDFAVVNPLGTVNQLKRKDTHQDKAVKSKFKSKRNRR